MVSTKKLEANRNNSKKSTGPRTDEGKEKSKLNALIHGLRAETMDVLPHEDPEAYRARVDAYLADFRPRLSVEADLVLQAADLSWKLERARRYERLSLSGRVEEAMGKASRARRDRFEDALQKLLPIAEEVKERRRLPRESAAWLRDQVEASAEGCQRLLAIWRELRDAAASGTPWSHEQELQAVRTMGFGPNMIGDTETLDLLVANRSLLYPRGRIDRYSFCDGTMEIYFKWDLLEEGFSRQPATPADAFALLLAAADRAIARLEGLRARRQSEDPTDGNAEAAERAGVLASFDVSDDGERLRRYQLSLHRELRRTIGAIAQLRREQDKLIKAESNCVLDCVDLNEEHELPIQPEHSETVEDVNPEPEPPDTEARRGSPDPAETDDRRLPDTVSAPNEATVQVLFATGDLRAAESAATDAPNEANRSQRRRRKEMKRRFEQARRAKIGR